MNRWSHYGKGIMVASLGAMLVSCASVSLQPGAENVRLAVGPAPKGCQLLGSVDSGTMQAPIASHKEIQKDQLESLKNQAYVKGANVVFLTAHQTTYYSQFIPSEYQWVPELDTHKMNGRAYSCNSVALNKLSKKT